MPSRSRFRCRPTNHGEHHRECSQESQGQYSIVLNRFLETFKLNSSCSDECIQTMMDRAVVRAMGLLISANQSGTGQCLVQCIVPLTTKDKGFQISSLARSLMDSSITSQPTILDRAL